MVSNVKQIHRPREVEIAVGIKGTDEFIGVGFKEGFNLEVQAKGFSVSVFLQESTPARNVVPVLRRFDKSACRACVQASYPGPVLL